MRFKQLIPLLAVSASIALGACSNAQKASEVTALRMPIAPYLIMSCNELATEKGRLVSQAADARTQVDAAYSSDKNSEVLAWILFAPAALMLDGNQKEATQLASIKGQLESVVEAQSVNNCIS